MNTNTATKIDQQELADLLKSKGFSYPHIHMLPSNERFSFTKLFIGLMQSEKLVCIFFMFSLFRDNFRLEFGDRAYQVWITHAVVIVICIFAGVIKKRVETSDITVKRGNTEVSLAGKDG